MHIGAAMADGLAGALVVRRAGVRESHRALYDEDKSDHVIILSEWTHSFSLQRLLQADSGLVAADALLINGRGASKVIEQLNKNVCFNFMLCIFVLLGWRAACHFQSAAGRALQIQTGARRRRFGLSA